MILSAENIFFIFNGKVNDVWKLIEMNYVALAVHG
jgi:hypothetical protein